MIRVFRYPGNRPGCEAFELVDDRVPDPEPGEHILEWDGIPRVARGAIDFLAPPPTLIPDLYDEDPS